MQNWRCVIKNIFAADVNALNTPFISPRNPVLLNSFSRGDCSEWNARDLIDLQAVAGCSAEGVYGLAIRLYIRLLYLGQGLTSTNGYQLLKRDPNKYIAT